MSTQSLRKELDRKGVVDIKTVLNTLRFYSEDVELEQGLNRPSIPIHHHGRSFYDQARFDEIERDTDHEADSKSAAEADTPADEAHGDSASDSEAEPQRRSYRQEEARLVTYVTASLEELYASDYAPSGIEAIAFDVHKQRAGSEYENVDVLAVHWRSPKRVDIIAVEVKLQFGPAVVHQAHNYTRFSNRVWIAVPVQVGAPEAAMALRAENPALFDYVVELGIGILGCHRRQGGRYNVFPLHWPSRLECDPLERDGLIHRYRTEFEDTGVVAPAKKQQYADL